LYPATSSATNQTRSSRLAFAITRHAPKRVGQAQFSGPEARVSLAYPKFTGQGREPEVVVALTPMGGPSLDTYPPAEPRPAYGDQANDIAAMYDNLFDDEAVDRIFRGRPPGIELLAVTNKRLMFLDCTSYEGRVALTSAPFGRVTSVSF
jgi:hypothetical protein